MTSFDYRLNPIYAIKECATCGVVYTADFCCSKKGLEDKILVPKPPRNCARCARCGTPVDGPYCHGCALLRKKFKEDLFTYYVENEFFEDLQDTSESSDDNTNVVNALSRAIRYDCHPQVPFVYNQDLCFIKTLIIIHKLHQFTNTISLFVKIAGPHENRPMSTMNEDYYHEQKSCYDFKIFGLTKFNPRNIPSITNLSNQNDLLNSQNKLMEQMTTLRDLVGQVVQKKEEEKRIAEEQAAKDRYWKIPICYDDDEDDTIAITPVLPIKEPDGSLSMGDEHLDTIPATESDEVIKSSVEDLVPIPSESEGIPDKMCDVPLCENTTPLNALNEHSEIIVNSNDDNSSSDDDSTYGEDIDYVDASSPDVEIVSLEVVEIVIPKVGGIDTNILLTIKDDILREKLLNVNLLIAKIDSLRDNPTPSSEVVIKSSSTSPNLFLEEINTFDNSSPEAETFCFDLEEISSGSPTTRSDLSLPDYKAFYVDNDHFKERSSGNTTTHVDFSQYDSFIFDLSNDHFLPADRSDLNHEDLPGR
ncbi:hypothetical protein Tco_0140237 [Tanacetum coccineum]